MILLRLPPRLPQFHASFLQTPPISPQLLIRLQMAAARAHSDATNVDSQAASESTVEVTRRHQNDNESSLESEMQIYESGVHQALITLGVEDGHEGLRSSEACKQLKLSINALLDSELHLLMRAEAMHEEILVYKELLTAAAQPKLNFSACAHCAAHQEAKQERAGRTGAQDQSAVAAVAARRESFEISTDPLQADNDRSESRNFSRRLLRMLSLRALPAALTGASPPSKVPHTSSSLPLPWLEDRDLAPDKGALAARRDSARRHIKLHPGLQARDADAKSLRRQLAGLKFKSGRQW